MYPTNNEDYCHALYHTFMMIFDKKIVCVQNTAEVTLGGVDCDALSSKTLESKTIAGLYFIGEVMDISGWLGGYNFQWSWSSGRCAGQYV